MIILVWKEGETFKMINKINRWIGFLLVFSIIFSFGVVESFALERYDNSFPVRVGIYYASTSKMQYSISGENLFISDGYSKIYDAYESSATISLSNNIYISSNSYSSYDEALMAALAQDQFVYYSNGSYYIASFSQNASISNNVGTKVIVKFQGGKTIALDGSNNIYLQSSENIVKIENTKYRGKFNFYIKGSNLHAINEVGMQDYLYGVLPKEMMASWEIEALKAQAVVAKNYTITNYNKHKADGFNVCATTHCQVYGGYSAEQEKTNKAVDQTESMVMMYDSKIAEGYFHASSGGRTESIGNMWNYPLPYMVGVDDPYSLGTPYDNWKVSFTADEIKSALLKRNVDIGNIVGVKILKTSENDRVMELGILGTKGMYTLEKDNIRSVLGSSKLKNTYFTIQNSSTSVSSGVSSNNVNISNKNLNNTFKDMDAFLDNKYSNSNQSFVSAGTYVFNGKGNGHGIGMSQYGANNMAKKGYNFEEILKYYFKGITIEN